MQGMTRIPLTTTIDHELKQKIENQTDYNFSELLQQKSREVLDMETEEDKTKDNIHSFDFSGLTDRQSRMAKFLMKHTNDPVKKQELIAEALRQNLYSSKQYCIDAVERVLSTDLPVVEMNGMIQADLIQCDGHKLRSHAVFSEKPEEGVCHVCGHRFDV